MESSSSPAEPRALAEEVHRFFADHDWPTAPYEEPPSLQMMYQGDCGRWGCLALIREEEQQLIVYSVCPAGAPQERRTQMGEFVTRANSRLSMGNFEMGYETGEVRFKTALDLGGHPISQALINQLVFGNVLLMDRYLPGIMAVLYGDVSPVDAIAQIEG
jgi:hypothetical protein